MPDYKKYYSNREIIKLDLVGPTDYTDNVILCVPKFAYDVARSMLAHYGKFRTSYAASYGDQFYELPDDNSFDTIEASIDLFLGSRDMSCDIVAALECICDAFQLQVAATNELVAATYTSSVSANYAGLPQQAAGVEGGSPPAGASAPDAGITDRKCKAAHYIVDNVNYIMFGLLTNPPPDWYDIGDTDNYLRQLGDTSSFGNLLTAIYGSYQDLASSIFGGAIDYEAIYDDIVLNYDAIICALSGAASATDARANFLAELTVVGDEYSFVADMLYNNILNTLWFAVADSEVQIASWPTTVDCSGCAAGRCNNYFLWFGTDTGGDLSYITSTNNTPYPGNRRWVVIGFNNLSFGGVACGPGVTLNDVTVVSGSVTDNWTLKDSSGATVYNATAKPSFPRSDISWLQVQSTPQTAPDFSIDVDWSY